MRQSLVYPSRAFTLIEMILVIIVIAVTSTLGLVVFTREFERRKGEEAEMNLIVIYNAQKRYKLTQGAYFTCTSCTPADIDRNLNIVILSNNFNFTIEDNTDSPGGYRAVAVRKTGFCRGKKAWLQEANSTVYKECELWK